MSNITFSPVPSTDNEIAMLQTIKSLTEENANLKEYIRRLESRLVAISKQHTKITLANMLN